MGRQSKLTPEMKVHIRQDRASGMTLAEAAKKYKVSMSTIAKLGAVRGKYYSQKFDNTTGDTSRVFDPIVVQVGTGETPKFKPTPTFTREEARRQIAVLTAIADIDPTIIEKLDIGRILAKHPDLLMALVYAQSAQAQAKEPETLVLADRSGNYATVKAMGQASH